MTNHNIIETIKQMTELASKTDEVGNKLEPLVVSTAKRYAQFRNEILYPHLKTRLILERGRVDWHISRSGYISIKWKAKYGEESFKTETLGFESEYLYDANAWTKLEANIREKHSQEQLKEYERLKKSLGL